MVNPYAHSNGTFSCVLRGEERGGEWLRLSAEGELTARQEIPPAQALCAHGENARALSGIPCERAGQAQLAVICAHEDGSYCCALVTPEGEIRPGAPFEYGEDWVVRPIPDGSGRIAFLHTQRGGVQVLFVDPGSADAPRRADIPVDLGEVEWVLDAAAAADGSVVFSGQLSKPAGVLARVSGEGDVLFMIETDDNVMHLAMTDEGFTGATSSQLLYYDEDGALRAHKNVDALYETEGMVAAGSTMLLLSHKAGAKSREVVLRSIAGGEDTEASAQSGVLFSHRGARMLSAQADAQGSLLHIALEDGSALMLLVAADGSVREETAAEAMRADGRMALEDGAIRCEKTALGALVTREDAQGHPLWQTRTLINTAADSLHWRCAAALEDGSVLLGGRYLTGSGGGARQQAVIAHIGADGVLRSMKTAAALGCVCAMRCEGEDVLLLCARGQWATSDAQTVVLLSRLDDMQSFVHLPLGLDQQDAFLLRGGAGELLAAGTHRKNGAQEAVLLQLDAHQLR